MAFNIANPSDLARLTLVASDMSYGGTRVPIGEPLRTYSEDGLSIPNPYDAELVESNYRVINQFEHDRTGYKAVLFRNLVTNDLIVAFAGTDGLDSIDWWGNSTHYGWNQWEDNRRALLDFLGSIAREEGQSFAIHFAGQSLGGALAQYALYEFAAENQGFGGKRLTLSTFNALGGLAALRQELGTSFDHGIVDGLGSIRHYYTPNDFVVRLGGGHLGAETYRLPFYPGGVVPGTSNTLLEFGIVEGHRIESGFYANLRQSYAEPLPTELEWFRIASRKAVDYLRVDDLQKAASFFANPLKSRSATTAEAALRLLSGAIFAPITTPRAQVNELVWAFADHARRSNSIDDKNYQFLRSVDWGLTAKWFAGIATVLNPLLLLNTFVGANVLSWLASGFGVTTSEAVQKVRSEFGTTDITEISASLPLHEHETQYRILAARMDAPTESALAALDPEQLARQLGSGDGWERRVLDYVQTAGLTPVEVAAVDARLGALMYESALAAKTGDGTYADAMYEMLVSHFEEMAQKVANSNGAFTAKYANVDSGVFGTALDFASYDAIHDALEDVASGTSNQRVKELIEAEIGIVEAAGQVVAIRAGHEANPFDGELEADSELPTRQLNEGTLQAFTAYLPYEAGADGQAIRFTLGGEAADKLKVLGGEERDLAADGTFTLTVPEGQREISFAIAALEDVDGDAAFPLSAQLVALVDGVEVATHLEHEELELALDADDETAPAGGMEYRGDWGLKLFPSFNPDGTPLLDKDGNQVFHTRFDTRYPPFTNL